MIPSVFGCPLWFGRIKNRVAKKKLSARYTPIWKEKALLNSLSNIKEGDLIRDCTGFNMKIEEINPIYRQYGKGWILVDIDLTSDKGAGCSFVHCGVEPAWTYKDILSNYEENIKRWKNHGDPWNFVKRYEFTTIHPDGQVTVDWQGLKEKYGL